MANKQPVTNGIIPDGNGGWFMLCGNTRQPVRLLDAKNNIISPETAEPAPRKQLDSAEQTSPA